MHRIFRAAAVLPLLALVSLPAPAEGQALPSIRRVDVLPSHGQVEIEVEASDRIVPQTNVLHNPDRLVIDFVNATPGAQLRGVAVNRAEVKNLRVGLFSKNPPVTRIVLDLSGPQPYQVFPSGRTVIVKVGGASGQNVASNAGGPHLVTSDYATGGAHLSVDIPPPPRPALAVTFESGRLTIFANKANLSEVLFAVHQRTGAEIAIPAGAEQEQVVAELGPAPAPEVISKLLNGSKFNFLIVSSPTDPRILDSVILSSRPEGPPPAPPRPQRQPVVTTTDEDVDTDAQPKPVPAPRPMVAPPPAADPNASPDQQGQSASPGTSDPNANPKPQMDSSDNQN